ncbi:MAG: SMP-30/gluconolactonase/LRE family protein [Deltaproteobacteria bacterium]|nr:SMP-30/gluconolactonase/LRE family protein [Deltaproteobacteria bacterium]
MSIDISAVKTIGSGILRPEGVMALDDGSLYTAEGQGRCARISRDGKTSFFGSVGGAPNGICIDHRGNCIIANIGNGEVQSLSPDGRHAVLMTEAGGKRMYAPNFPFIDSKERLWVSNSTARPNVEEALQKPAADGCIVLIEKGQPRIVAEEIYFANGLAIDAEEKFLYVAETMKRRVLRFKIGDHGSLSGREIYGPKILGKLGFPDGIAFDEAGNLWVTFPSWNAIGYLTPQQELKIFLEDPQSRVLKRPSNICFGWEERRTAFIGSLDGSTIPYFEVPYPGMKLIHQK